MRTEISSHKEPTRSGLRENVHASLQNYVFIRMSGIASWMRRARALINIKKEKTGIGRGKRRNWGEGGGTEESKQGRDK